MECGESLRGMIPGPDAGGGKPTKERPCSRSLDPASVTISVRQSA